MKCFYHSADLDGLCSGAIVRRRFQACEMYGFDYGMPFPWDMVKPGEMVIMVDVSLPMPEMARLNDMCALIWIDHHKSAIDEAFRLELVINGKQVIGKAGCELAWEFCFGSMPMPRGVWMLGRYDVFDLGAAADVLAFQYGLRGRDTRVESDVWKEIFLNHKPFTDEVTQDGRTVLRYQAMQDAEIATERAFATAVNGLRVIAINGNRGSQRFDSVWDAEKFDAMCAFYLRRDGMWCVSLYSVKPEVDCGAVCKALGGGGHKGAAGFMTRELPAFLFAGDARN